MKFLLLFIILLSIHLSIGIKTIKTSYGKVRGLTYFADKENLNHVFKAIPFAKPPLGDLRFAKPQPPDHWNHVLDASVYSPACLSNSTLSSTPQENISEDCLYLNIFTSNKCLEEQCPVIVYFHGGSYNLDSATMFPDDFILERYVDEGIVFVIPAYRLGVFGQFWLGEENEEFHSNVLIYDTIAALEFVHNEISSFGGNPDDVTIMGHSSGGNLVNDLGFSTEIDKDMKLFQKMIVLSSHGLFGFAGIQMSNSKIIAERVGCSPRNSTKEVYECMRTVDSKDLLTAQVKMEVNENLVFRSIIRAPPVMTPNEKIADLKKNAKPRKMLCGVTEHEFERFKYRDYYVSGEFLDFENPVDVVMTYRNNFTHIAPYMVNSDSSSVFVSAATYSEAMVNAGGEVYLFETRQKPYSMHVSDMQFFIGIHREKVHTPDMDILDEFYSKLLVNFTKYGEPSPNWQKYDPAKLNFLALEVDTQLGIGPQMEDGFHKELLEFWEKDMMELDRNISLKKAAENEGDGNNVYPTLLPYPGPADKLPEEIATSNSLNDIETTTNWEAQHVETTKPSPTIQAPESTSPDVVTDSDQDALVNDSPIYTQWWFYVIVLLAFLVLIFVFIVLKRSTNPEETPLLG